MGEPGKAMHVMADRRREEQLRTLGLSAAALIADAEDTASAIPSVIRAICESEGWECGRYLKPSRECLRLAGAWGIPDPVVQRFLARAAKIDYRFGEGLTGEVWTSGAPLWVADVAEDRRAKLRGMTEEFMPRGAFLFPVRSRGAMIGVLSFNSRERREPDERLLSVILAIGSQIGQFLERKRAEEELRLSETRLRTVFESASEGIISYDRDGRIVSVNGAAERLLGVPKERLLGAQGFISLVPCFDEHGVQLTQGNRGAPRALQTGKPVTGRVVQVRRADGATAWVAANIAPLFASGEAQPYGVVTTLTDITHLKRGESLLRLEQRVSKVFDAPQDAKSALTAALQAVCEGEGWDCGRYLEVAGEELIAFAEWSIRDPAIEQYIARVRTQRYTPGLGLVGKVWQSREPMWVLDIRTDPRAGNRALALEMGAVTALVVPVLAQDAVIGVFIFHSRSERPQDLRLLQSMQLIGAQIGQLVRRAKAEEAVRLSEARFRSLCELSSDIFWETDAEHRFRRITDSAGVLETTTMIGKTPWDVPAVNMTPESWAAHRALVNSHRPFRDVELCRVDRAGLEAWLSVSGEPVFAGGAFAGYRGVGRNITAQKLDERRIRHLATHDALTGLPNRAAFSELLNAARASARRTSRSLAVMFVDLDRFKVINDTLGHEVGDQVLCETARRLRHTLRASDVVARLGGDEFVVMVPELDDPSQAERAARKALAALVQPMTFAGHELASTASIGIALYPRDGEDEQSLMKAADVAMYRAKEAGRNTFKFRGGDSDVNALKRLAMETSLRRALERGEFFLLYQPRVSLATGVVTGVEALLRWRHPDLGVVQPAEFVGLAEDTGAIHEIGRWVLGASCDQAARWRAAGLPPVRVAVNVSARQFAQDELLGHISNALALSGLAADGLELEITESVVAQNIERATEVLAAVRKLGVRVALDDFGMGYSSLAQLKRFPVDTLKIDRAFVDDLPHDPDDVAIAQAILTMGRSLGLTVVAEGVEDAAQHAFLKKHGCDEMQGFFLAPPLSAEDCAAFLRRPFR